MNLTLQTQLLPDPESAAKLKATVERFNEAASWLAGVAFERKIANKFALQKLCYAELRERFGLPADTAIRCIAQVVEAYKRDKDKRPKFRKHASVPFSMGKNIGFKGPDRVSISTLKGRVVLPYVLGKYQADRFGWSKGQCDLVLRKDGKWFLLVTVDVPDGTKPPTTDFLGVDLGVINIAVDSDGQKHTSEKIEAKRLQYATRRRTLGKATRGARRSKRRHCHKAIARSKKREARYKRTSITRSASNSLQRPKTPDAALGWRISKASVAGHSFASGNERGSAVGRSFNCGRSWSTRQRWPVSLSRESTPAIAPRRVPSAAPATRPTARASRISSAACVVIRPMLM